MKLASIKQLGPTYLVYPGATHTRYNHSLGVYHVAKRFMYAIGHQNANLFSEEGILTFLCAALCHDLGHFPFTHSLKELPLKDHETLSAEIILSPELAHIIKQIGLKPEAVASIIDHSIPCNDQELLWYRGFLSGVLDPDKIDYLQRDAYFCGLPYGTQDIDFILRSLVFNESTGLGIQEDGIRTIEHLLFSKYLLYRSVYWHPQVRIATAMIKKALFHALKTREILPQELYGHHDASFLQRFQNAPSRELKLIPQAFASRLYNLIHEVPLHELSSTSHIMSLEFRNDLESSLANLLTDLTGHVILPHQVLIDIPENISFEVHIPVHVGQSIISYPQARTVFSREVIQSFTHNLRYLRVAIDPALTAVITTKTPVVQQAITELLGATK